MLRNNLMSKVRVACRYYSKSAQEAGHNLGGHEQSSGSLRGAKTVLTGERGMNKVMLLGRVGKDSEVRGTVENPVTVFPLATSYTLKTVDGKYVQRTEWHRVSIFRPVLRDIAAQNIKKGDKVFVSGSINYSQFKDQSDVVQRVANIVADDVVMLTRSAVASASEESDERSHVE